MTDIVQVDQNKKPCPLKKITYGWILVCVFILVTIISYINNSAKISENNIQLSIEKWKGNGWVFSIVAFIFLVISIFKFFKRGIQTSLEKRASGKKLWLVNLSLDIILLFCVIIMAISSVNMINHYFNVYNSKPDEFTYINLFQSESHPLEYIYPFWRDKFIQLIFWIILFMFTISNFKNQEKFWIKLVPFSCSIGFSIYFWLSEYKNPTNIAQKNPLYQLGTIIVWISIILLISLFILKFALSIKEKIKKSCRKCQLKKINKNIHKIQNEDRQKKILLIELKEIQERILKLRIKGRNENSLRNDYKRIQEKIFKKKAKKIQEKINKWDLSIKLKEKKKKIQKKIEEDEIKKEARIKTNKSIDFGIIGVKFLGTAFIGVVDSVYFGGLHFINIIIFIIMMLSDLSGAIWLISRRVEIQDIDYDIKTSRILVGGAWACLFFNIVIILVKIFVLRSVAQINGIYFFGIVNVLITFSLYYWVFMIWPYLIKKTDPTMESPSIKASFSTHILRLSILLGIFLMLIIFLLNIGLFISILIFFLIIYGVNNQIITYESIRAMGNRIRQIISWIIWG